MASQPRISHDLAAFRAELRHSSVPYRHLLRPHMLRSLGDIACDIGVVGLAVWAAKISLWLTPLAVLLIGNRQRSLGNILHDGSHGSLHPSRGVKDALNNGLRSGD